MANPKELQKFLDLWGPVVASLPAVINSLERENDLNRNLAIMEARLQELNKQCEDAAGCATEALNKIRDELDAVQAQKANVATEVLAAKGQAQKDIADAKKAADVDIAAHKARAAKARSDAAAVEKDAAVRIAKADADITAKVAAGEAVLAELEARRLIAEKVLADLRAKLG